MSISIVIPTLNEENFLPNLLESIKKQTAQPLETIIADAHSIDKTREIARSFGCKVVEGGMPGVGRNKGAAIAKGDVILFLDSDVLLSPDFLAKNGEEFKAQKLFGASCYLSPIRPIWRDKILYFLLNFFYWFSSRTHPVGLGACIFIKRSLHQKIHGFDETITFGEDYDYVQRASKLGTFAFLSSVKVSVSSRRLDRDGFIKTLYKFIYSDIYQRLHGPIRKDIFEYQFGHY